MLGAHTEESFSTFFDVPNFSKLVTEKYSINASS